MSGKGVRYCKAEGPVDSNSQQDAIRPGRLLFSSEKRKESCARTGRRRGRGGDGGGGV